MPIVIRPALVALSLALAHAPALLSQGDSAAPAMAGLSNGGRTSSKPYVTAGTRTYLIGTQDGNFPDMGQHLPGEMGGAWLHPIKLIDGFRATVTDRATNRDIPLSAGTDFVTYPYGNRFTYALAADSLEIERFEFSPDGRQGLIVRYEFRNAARRTRHLSFQWSVKTDLRPVWFSDSLGITDAGDTVAWEPDRRVFVARDSGHPWFCVWGATPSADARPVDRPEPIATRGMGVTAASHYAVSVAPRGAATLTFVIAGSDSAREAALDTYAYLAQHHASLLAEKQARYAALLQRARVSIPDKRLQQVYDWVRVNTEWLDREVPGIGRGLGGGLMEYPWWFGTDASYSLQALASTGSTELAKATLRLLRDQSLKANGNGRIVHEVTTNGGVVNPGNTQETAQFIAMVGTLVAWTGDLAFAREMYPSMRLGLRWLLGDMDRNRNLFPEGYGIMEVSGLNAELIDVAVYTEQALEATARVARVLGKPAAAAGYERQAAALKARINDRFWAEDEASYADFYGTRAQAMSAADGAIRQIRLKGDSALTARDHELIGHYEAAQAAVRRAAGREPRVAHQQELGDRDADGDRHRAARAGRPAARQDPPRERRRVRPLPLGRRAAGDDDDRDRRPGRGRGALRADRRVALVREPDRGDVRADAAGFGLGDDARLRLLHDRVDQLRRRGAADPACLRDSARRGPPDGGLRSAGAEWLGGHEHRGPAGRNERHLLCARQDRRGGRVPHRRPGRRVDLRVEGEGRGRRQVLYQWKAGLVHARQEVTSLTDPLSFQGSRPSSGDTSVAGSPLVTAWACVAMAAVCPGSMMADGRRLPRSESRRIVRALPITPTFARGSDALFRRPPARTRPGDGL